MRFDFPHQLSNPRLRYKQILSVKAWLPLLACLVVICLTTAGSSAQDAASAVRAGKIKAAAVYYLIQFIRWPESAFKNANDPLLICPRGEDPLFNYLEETMKGKSSSGRSIAIASPNSNEKNCAMYVTGQKLSELELAKITSPAEPWLTVGLEGFVSLGGLVELYEFKNRLKIKLSLSKLQAKGYTVSSELLEIAEIAQ